MTTTIVVSRDLYIVELDDQCDESLVGHSGCSYTSPPQLAGQALALVRALLGCTQRPLDIADGTWKAPIAGGRRVIRVHRAEADGQLTI